MKRITITMFGKVQKVGLRIKIANIAGKLGVCGMVDNLDDGSVLMVCEAKRQVLDEMIRQIKQIPSPVIITNMTVVETSPASGMSGFQVLGHDADEEWKAAIKTGMGLLEKISKTLDSSDKTQKEIAKTQKATNKTLTEIKDTLTSMDGAGRVVEQRRADT